MNEEYRIRAYCGLVENDSIWLYDECLDMLFKADSEGNFKSICHLKQEKESEIFVIKLVYWEGKVFAFSRYKCGYWIIQEQLPGGNICDFHKYVDNCSIQSVEQHKNEVWIFPQTSDTPINCINLDTLEVDRIEWMCSENINSITKTIYQNNHIYFATRSVNNVYVGDVDCINREIKYFNVDKAKYVNCVCIHQESIYVLYLNNAREVILEKYTLDGMSERTYVLNKTINMKDSMAITFNMMEIEENHLILYQYDVCRIIDVDLETGKTIEIYNKKDKVGGFSEAHRYKGKVFLTSICGDIGVFDIRCKQFEIRKCYLSKNIKYELLKDTIMRNNLVFDSPNIGIESLIHVMCK